MKKIGTIKAYVSYNDYTKTHYYENFDIIDELPKINDEYFDDKLNNFKNLCSIAYEKHKKEFNKLVEALEN